MSRLITDLTPECQVKYYAFDIKMKEAGIDYIITCTFRSQEEQTELYAQGRTKPGPKVTWTLSSRHTKRTAFDIVLITNGKPDWNKANPNWVKAGEIAESVGLEWGGRWPKKKQDYPHFQLPENNNI